jgi:hypothetical protein
VVANARIASFLNFVAMSPMTDIMTKFVRGFRQLLEKNTCWDIKTKPFALLIIHCHFILSLPPQHRRQVGGM